MYCTSCAFKLADDWNHCPKCGTQKANSENSIQITDTVLMGDLNINKKEDISAAVKESHECTSCGSMGALQKACKHCKTLLYCEVCESDFQIKIRKNFWDDPKYSNDYKYDFTFSRRQIKGKEVQFEEYPHDSVFVPDDRQCFECLDKIIIPNMDHKCWCCGLYCRGRQAIRLMENGVKNIHEYSTCQKCIETHDLLNLAEHLPGGRIIVMEKKWEWKNYVEFHNLPDDYLDLTGVGERKRKLWTTERAENFWSHHKKWNTWYERKEIRLPIPSEITERIIQCVDLDARLTSDLANMGHSEKQVWAREKENGHWSSLRNDYKQPYSWFCNPFHDKRFNHL